MRQPENSIASVIETAAFCFFLATIVLFAFLEGRVGEPLRSLLALLLSVFAALRASAAVLRPSFQLSEQVLILPLAGVVALSFLQIAPLHFLSSVSSKDPFETKNFIIFFSALIISGDALRHLLSSSRRLRFLVGSVVCVGVCSAAYGIVRAAFVVPDEQYAQFLNRNHYALMAEMCIGFLFGLLINGQLAKGFRLAGSLLAALIGYSLFTSGSRGGIVSLVSIAILAVILRVFVLPSRNENRFSHLPGSRSNAFSRTKFLGAIATCVLIGAVSLTAVALLGGERVVSRFEQVRDEVELQSDQRMNRGTIWNITTDLIKEHPIIGVGFGAYPVAITRFDHSNGSWPLEEAHNEYLEILANGGAVGFALFGMFLILVGKRALRNLKVVRPADRWLCFGAVLGLFAVLVHSLVDFGLHIPINALLFVILVVVAIGPSSTPTRPGGLEDPSENPRRVRNRIAALAYLAISLLIGGLAGRHFLTECFAAAAATNNSLSDATLSLSLHESDPTAQKALGLVLLNGGDYGHAASAFSRAVRSDENDYKIWELLGITRDAAGDVAGAEEAYRRSISLAPHYSAPKYLYGKLLIENDRPKDGFEVLSGAAENNFSIYRELVDLAGKSYLGNAVAIEQAASPETKQTRKYLARYFITNSLMSTKTRDFLLSTELADWERNEFVGELIAQHNYALAHDLWSTSFAASKGEPNELIFDGGFEHTEESAQGGFGWQVEGSLSGMSVSRTRQETHSGEYAIQFHFTGRVDPGTSILEQLVYLKPNTRYVLTFFYFSREMVSASTPVVVITDAVSHAELGRSQPLKASDGAWVESSVKFATAQAPAAKITLLRPSCDANPCPLFGELTMDDFSLAVH